MNSSWCLHSHSCFNPSPTFSVPLSLSLPLLNSSFGPKRKQNKFTLRKKNTACRAHLIDDGPFAVAIGACMLTSLLFPVSDGGQDEDDGDSAIDATEARFAVMGIVSFIPYFNWLSWVFAWFDTGKRRYAVYSLVYLAPYLRSNLSLSPEESWLPIASIIFCIIHIQLEASIRNGDIQGLQIFRGGSNKVSSSIKKDKLNQHEEISKASKKENMNLPPSGEPREIGDWEDPQRSSPFHQRLSEDLLEDDDDRSKH